MARIRTIKPEFWTAEQVMECSPLARLLFIGMWNFCDDQGVHPVAYKTLKAEVFPGDDITCEEVKKMVDEIIAQGLLGEFEHEGRRWWFVTGWSHQLINRPSQSRYPRPPRSAPLPLAAGPDGPSGKGLDDFALTTTGGDASAPASTHGALTESSVSTHGALTEDSLQERKGKEGKGRERNGEKQKPAQQASSEVQARDQEPAAGAAVRFDAAEFLVEHGADQQTAADYLALRKEKKATRSRTAMCSLLAEADKAGMPLQEVLTTCCLRGWAGFKAEWAVVQQARASPKPPSGREARIDNYAAQAAAARERNGNGSAKVERDITAEVIRIA